MGPWTTPQVVTLLVAVFVALGGWGLRMSSYVNLPLGLALIWIGAGGAVVAMIWGFLDPGTVWLTSLAAAVLAGAVIVGFWPKARWAVPRLQGRDSATAMLSALAAGLKEQNRPQVKSGREVPYSGDRTPVLSVTIGELREKMRGKPSFRTDTLVEPYLGKWMPVEGEVKDILHAQALPTCGLRSPWRLAVAYFFTKDQTSSHSAFSTLTSCTIVFMIRPAHPERLTHGQYGPAHLQPGG